MTEKAEKNNDLLNNALNDFQKAIKTIEFCVENLKKTQENMKTSIDKFNEINRNNRNLMYSFHGIQTIDEKITQMKEDFATFLFDDKIGRNVIVFQPLK